MKPTNDAQVVKTHCEEVIDDIARSPHMPSSENYPAILFHDDKYMRYDIFGNVFEVTTKYKPIESIGHGAYGFVCSAVNLETNEKVAIKKIVNAFEDKVEANRTLREIMILGHLNDHENIVEIKEVILPPERDSFKDIYVVCEFVVTDLSNVIAHKDQLTDEHFKYLLYQLLRGLKYIHSANVIHRDLKPGNLLLSSTCDLKICDFGHARGVSEDHSMTTYVVTRWYRAPELILDSSVYTSAVDVWSVGCIFLEMVGRKPLFPGKNPYDQLKVIMKLMGTPTERDLGAFSQEAAKILRLIPPLPRQSLAAKFPNVTPSAIDLMEKMLTLDPRERITVEEALAHPYLSEMHNIEVEPVCEEPFNFELEGHPLTEKQIRELIYNEALAYNNP